MMNFAIEVTAEANPLSKQTLYHVLQSSTSNDQQQIKTGTQQLQNWETTVGFYSSLQSIYVDYTIPVELRYLAILQLKNGIDKYWRKTAPNAIKKEEKESIRSQLISSGIMEPDPRLALQISIAIGKITRFEYPHEWPDAISSTLRELSSALSAGNSVRLSRAFLILLHIIKVLASAKLLRHRTSLQSVAPDIIESLSSIYVEKVNTWIKLLRNGDDEERGTVESIDQSLLALRILRRLLVAGYEFPSRHQEVKDVWSMLASQSGEILALLHGESASIQSNSRSLIEKHLFQISKLHLNMIKVHPAAFPLLPDSMNIAKAWWSLARQFGDTMGSQTFLVNSKSGLNGEPDAEDRTSALEKLSLSALTLIRGCLKMVYNPMQTFKYQRAEDKEEKKIAQERVKNELLTGVFAQEIMESLVTRFLVLTPRDLKQWEEDPEEWERTQESSGEDWDISIRTCSEKLFLDLIINYKELLVQPLIHVFRAAADLQNTDVLLKDSIYCAIGLAAPTLDRYSEFDIGYFLDHTLVEEIQIGRPGYNILRRRIAVLLGHWLPIREGLNRALVYQIFQHLLSKEDLSNDLAVRIAAGKQLKHIIDPFEFTAEPFMPYASAIFDRLMALIVEVEQIETKRELLNTINVIVLKMEQQIVPYTDQIISLLIPLWDQAAEEPLMQQSILGILCSVATSMQAESRRYHPILIPVIRSSIDTSSEMRSSYLSEDGLELLSIVLMQTPSEAVSSDIISLVQYVLPLVDIRSGKKTLEIIELYIYLIPAEILSNVGIVLAPLVSLLRSARREGTGTATSLVEILIRQADSLGGIAAVSELAQSLLSSNWLSVTLAGLRKAFLAHQTSGPNRTTSAIDGVVETDYLNVLARLAVASPPLFITALDATTYDDDEAQGTLSPKLDWLLTEWFSHIDSIGHPVHKKLHCLALTSLLETAQPWILGRLQSLMTVWTDVINELVIDGSLQEGVVDKRDCLVYTDPDASKPEGPESPADLRSRLLEFRDPVHQIDVRSFVRDKLAIAIESCGGMEAFQRDWVQNVDEDVVKGFGALGII